MENDEAIDVALADIAPANDSPLGINVLFSGPDTISIFAANNSPFWNTEFSLPKLEESYLMYNVRLSLTESVESNIFTIVADTPDVNPTILRLSNWSIYDLTVTPKYSLFISTHAKLLS